VREMASNKLGNAIGLRPPALHRQAFTTLRASTSEHLPARAGSHARTKAVSTLTMNFARLVSTLHDESRKLDCCLLTARRKCVRKTRAKTITWWAKRKGGKGTQRAQGCQAETRTAVGFCEARDLWITSLGWV
jgi:hypothetical protein